jgi:hypothetical protein
LDCAFNDKLATGLTGGPHIGLWSGVAAWLLHHLPCGNKAAIPAQEMFGSAFRQNFDNVSHNE